MGVLGRFRNDTCALPRPDARARSVESCIKSLHGYATLPPNAIWGMPISCLRERPNDASHIDFNHF